MPLAQAVFCLPLFAHFSHCFEFFVFEIENDRFPQANNFCIENSSICFATVVFIASFGVASTITKLAIVEECPYSFR